MGPRLGEIIHDYADISKTKRLLKFEPNYNQGLKGYSKWLNNKHGTNLNVRDYFLKLFELK